MVQPLHLYMTAGKTIALTIRTFVGKVMSLLFNKLSTFVINEDHGIRSHHFMANRETMEIVTDFILGAPKSLKMVTAAMRLKDAYSLEEKL